MFLRRGTDTSLERGSGYSSPERIDRAFRRSGEEYPDPRRNRAELPRRLLVHKIDQELHIVDRRLRDDPVT
jgi:hypothetical protein